VLFCTVSTKVIDIGTVVAEVALSIARKLLFANDKGVERATLL
jgi:hypothetical protein